MKNFTKPLAIAVLILMGGGIALAGLETVTHIQDLNASWPLGSDLASTSDDHVRNIKSALKTDFPNFNGTYTSASAPVFAIPSDTNTGMYSVGADDLGFSTGGTLRLDISTSAFTGTLPWRGQDGSSATPALSFSGDTDSGVYRAGANDVRIATGGTDRIAFNSTVGVQIASGQVLGITDGTAGAPALTFSSDPDTGLFRAGANSVDLAAGGTRILAVQSTGLYAANGSAASPIYSFLNDGASGFYRDTTNQIGITLGGSTAGQIAQGSYTATITGCTTSPTVSVAYQRIGKMVMLDIPTITCTSNTSQFTLTGAPAVITPSTTTGTHNISDTQDTGVRLFSSTYDMNTSGTLTFYTGGNASGWTASGTKGIPVRTQLWFLII